MHFMKQKNITSNLCIMMITWTATISNFYLLYYLVNSLSHVYTSAIAITCSDVVAITSSGFLLTKLGVSKSLKTCFGLASIGGLLMLTWGLKN